MSKPDDILEKNVETLIHAAYDPPAIDGDARARIRARLLERAAPQPVTPPRRWSAFTVAGGALAAAAAIALVAGNLGTSAPRVTTDGDQVTLGDDAVAIVGPGGAVTAIGERRVRVTGPVYLDVTPGRGRYVVETPHGTVEVLGTRFVVDAQADETTAAVLRGAVKLATGGGEVVVHAGEQGTMRPGARPTRAPAPRLSHLVGWAREARVRAEGDGPRRRSGTLYARDPQWQERDFPLPMRALTVDVVVENQVARVALDQTFHNPQPQTLEGVYRFTVPPDAALSRLAMYVEGTLTESAVVERMQARRIYEDIVYRRRDPALAEWTGAGRVDLRIFPLFGRQDRRVITAYTQPLPRLYDDWTLTVPMPDLDDPVGEVAMNVRIADCARCEIASPSHAVEVARDGDAAIVTYRKAGERLGDSLVLTVRDPATEARVARLYDDGQQYLLVRDRVALRADAIAGAYRPRTWVILADHSASRGALERRAQADLVSELVDAIDEDDRVVALTFDVGVRRHGELVRAADIDRRALRASLLGERGGVGATDLGAALDEAARLLAGVDPRDAYVVYLGDGVVTGGARDLALLRARLEGKATFVGFAVGDGADVPSLGALAAATGGLVVSIDPADDLSWRALDAIATLYTPRVTGIAARAVDPAGRPVEGAIVHLRAPTLAEGDELEVVVRAPARAEVAAIEIAGERAGAAWAHRVDLAAAVQVERAGYLPRLWAQRQVEALMLARNATGGLPEAERIAQREALRKEIVALGKQFFLLSPHTSLIVLENDKMYAEYGVAKGVNDGWAPYLTPATIPVVTRAGLATADAGDLGLVRTPVQPFYHHGWEAWDSVSIGDGRFGTIGTGSGTGAGFGAGGGGSGLTLRGDADVPLAGATADSTVAPRATAGESEAAKDEDDAELQLVTTDELREQSNAWQVGRGERKKAKRSRRGPGGGLGRRGASAHAGYWGGGGAPYPQAWNHAADWRLDDLTEFVPAFFPGALDEAIAELRLAGGGARGRIDDGARAMLVAARRAVPAGVYRWGDGPAIAVGADGAMTWEVVHDTGLVEQLRFDGATLRRRYDELGLEIVRALGDAAPALLTTVLPLVVPDPDHLARWYVVAKKSDRVITLAPASAPDAPTLELELDGDDRLVAIRTGRGRELLAIRWAGDAPVAATIDGATVTIARAAAPAVPLGGAGPALVEIALPLRPPAYWRNRLDELPPAERGDDTWRAAQRALLASLAATHDTAGAAAVLRELEAAGGLALGDLVLGAAALAQATSDDDLVRLLASAGDAGRRVGRYLSASRAYRKKPRPGVFAPVATVDDAPLLATLAGHRETLAQLEAGKLDRALTSLRAARHGGVLRVIAAAQIGLRWDARSRAEDAWDAVADGAWRNVARYEAARARYNRGDQAGAAARFVEVLTDYDPDALPVSIDWTAKSAITYGARGQVGWQLAWSAYRNTILDRGDFADVIDLLGSAAQIGEPDVDRVLGRAADLAGDDPDAIAEIVARALALGQVDRAAPLLERALGAEPTPDLLRLAAQVAERQGRVADAADLLDRALAAEGDGPVPLAQLRADLGRLLALRGRVALLATGAAREAALDAALDVSDRWREVDPDNAQIDRAIGELLLAGGRREEAWRQLSTAIERRPMEGDGWALVAEVMEREGRLEEALGYWQQAIVIDQTNPTWRLRKAQALFALGRDADGDALLDEIAGRTWHDRWAGVVYQVESMRAQRKAGR